MLLALKLFKDVWMGRPAKNERRCHLPGGVENVYTSLGKSDFALLSYLKPITSFASCFIILDNSLNDLRKSFQKYIV